MYLYIIAVRKQSRWKISFPDSGLKKRRACTNKSNSAESTLNYRAVYMQVLMPEPADASFSNK
ncbi:hypothetical protein C6Y45_06085 [Alkalicoccus saliphilus]|uniref:Uncharacterized protein n=1 Tax=Alkalicoccus saliphilus TaxID=200989 RepID=A0A2T4U7M5_9BACI|nr:hypothetical protein C6Y45_06085 [Alkalicoccus saliphilus]